MVIMFNDLTSELNTFLNNTFVPFRLRNRIALPGGDALNARGNPAASIPKTVEEITCCSYSHTSSTHFSTSPGFHRKEKRMDKSYLLRIQQNAVGFELFSLALR